VRRGEPRIAAQCLIPGSLPREHRAKLAAASDAEVERRPDAFAGEREAGPAESPAKNTSS
jgi:hypothetical protein